MSTTATATQQTVRSTYRILARLVQLQPRGAQGKAWSELRTGFRRPLNETESLEDRVKKANDRISFLRITTPKPRMGPQQSSSAKAGTTYVYKNGKLVEEGDATRFDANGRVISNWDGKNLDPCMVKRHKAGLRRAGFVNNAHAKGIF